MQIKYKLQSRS